jgi:hypothetical protein
MGTFLLTACVSVQKNYLGSNKEKIKPLNRILYPLSDGERNFLNRYTDSLLTVNEQLKKAKKPLKAIDINELYSGFGIQLDHDRYYNAILQKGKENNDSIKWLQAYAAAQLLSSAASYDTIYQENRLVRRALNRGETGNNIPKKSLQRSRNYLYAPSVREKIAKQNKKCYYPATDSILGSLPKTNHLKALFYTIYRKNDRFNSLIYNISHAGSYVVGNSVGIFHGSSERKVYADLVIPFLKPYDIILMKSPHHLTDKLVPGYFGHAAIWLGPELAKGIISNDNQDNGTGNNLTSEKTIVEALRSGVKVSSLEEFADGEDFLVLRIKELSESNKKSILTNINKQMQKQYDFNFDIESPEAISCTELIFLAYDFIDWQVRYTWSRYTISPDDLPSTALKNDVFEFPAFIQNDKVYENPDKLFVKSTFGLSDEQAHR